MWYLYKYRVDRCSDCKSRIRRQITRRFDRKATSKAQHHDLTRWLNNVQEKELLRYIRRLCERYIPPTLKILASITHEICRKKPSKKWATRFVVRHMTQIDARHLNTIDLSRHETGFRASYEQCFDVWSATIEEHDILPQKFSSKRFRKEHNQIALKSTWAWSWLWSGPWFKRS